MSAFTRKWMVGLLALALVTAISSWWIARHEAGLSCHVKPHDALSPAPDLGLTKEQARKVTLLEKAYRARVGELCTKHCAARARIARHLATQEPIKSQLLSEAKEASEAYSELEIATVHHVLEVGSCLTPEQRARYFASMAGFLGAQCPRRGSMVPLSKAP